MWGIEVLISVSLTVGAGYGGAPEWRHGQGKGEDWSSAAEYDLTDPATVGSLPYSTVDHTARTIREGCVGCGMFEHPSMGRHDPTGFKDCIDMAPWRPLEART